MMMTCCSCDVTKVGGLLLYNTSPLSEYDIEYGDDDENDDEDGNDDCDNEYDMVTINHDNDDNG